MDSGNSGGSGDEGPDTEIGRRELLFTGGIGALGAGFFGFQYRRYKNDEYHRSNFEIDVEDGGKYLSSIELEYEGFPLGEPARYNIVIEVADTFEQNRISYELHSDGESLYWDAVRDLSGTGTFSPPFSVNEIPGEYTARYYDYDLAEDIESEREPEEYDPDPIAESTFKTAHNHDSRPKSRE